jgi:RNA-binding motif X-linked protein 2
MIVHSNVREVNRINERELDLAVEGRASWHDEYRDSAYIFVGNLDKRLTEGDVIAVFSQYGEILDINLPRVTHNQEQSQGSANAGQSSNSAATAAKPGDRRGFGFLLYEDQRSTVLAVDNLNGFALLGRTLRVDHVRDYKMPRRRDEEGQTIEADAPSRNAAPQITGRRSASPPPDFAVEEDPMAAYIKTSDDKQERRRRKEERRQRREERERRRRKHERRTSESPGRSF